MLQTTILPFEQWPLVRSIVSREFNDGLPTSKHQATFAALMEGATLAGFFHIERLYHFNSLYVMPDYRNQGCAGRLIGAAVQSIPEHESAIWLAPQDKGGALARGMGFRDIGVYRVFRKDR